MEKKIKENIKKLTGEKARISYFEIFILVLSTFAFSYLIYETGEEIESVEAQTNNIAWNCCPETNNGTICQDVVSGYANCNSSLIPTKCEQVSSCKLGCCFDEQEGLCSPRAPKQKCVNEGGKWYENEVCNIEECRLGCCVIGSNVEFVSEKRCERLSAFYGFQPDFRAEIRTELECLVLSNTQAVGACVIETENEGSERTCKFNSKAECLKLEGDFFENQLCTNPELNTTCEKTENTICIEGKDEVYFQDSCGNPANIYDAGKVNDNIYWEKIVGKGESCGASDLEGNANSLTCGNCNYLLGSKCKNYLNTGNEKPDFGENICVDMSCKNAPANVGKKDRRNGESWCVYDGYIGEGRDVVGSRHWKYYCLDGEVKVEPCADYRNEICVESVVEAGEKFSTASCRINRWQECMEYNIKETNVEEAQSAQESMSEKCQKNIDCFVKKVNVDDNFKFNYCSPNYPPGFDLTIEGGAKSAEAICGQASQKCTVIYVKKGIPPKWVCEVNCDCETAKFTQQMNDFCVSLGDCGGYVNIEGVYTDDGYKVKNAPKLGSKYISKYVEYAKPVEGQKAEPGNLSEIAGLLGIPENLGEGEEPRGGGAGFAVGLIGATGIATLATILATAGKGGIIFHLTQGFVLSADLTGSFGWAAFGNAMYGAFIGGIVGLIIAKLFGLDGTSATIVAVVGMVAAGYVALTQGGISALWGMPGIIILVILIVVALIMKLLGIGKTKKVIVTFTCKPWQPPVGGKDCGKCSEDLKTCSKYRCWSLGTACKFLNEGTGKELCVASQNDGKAPIIKPWQDILNKNFTYTNITDNGFSVRNADGSCIKAYTPLTFGITTDKASQCKVETNHTLNYESMADFFGDSNIYTYNHSMYFILPDAQALSYYYNMSLQDVLNRIGKMQFYVRCQDDWGNFNLNEYLIDLCIKPGPDKTPPSITRTIPANNAYLAFNSTQQNIMIYVNEPAECKWNILDKSYENMNNNFSCNNDLDEMTAFGWACSSILTNLSTQKFYFRCKDQPWLGNESARNVNQESYVYELRKSSSQLKIDKIEPNRTIVAGVEPFSVELKAYTSGGAENGKAECSYKFTEGGIWIQFYDTFSTIHKQMFNYMISGDYRIYVECEDVAGNVAEGETIFTLELDTITPKVIRVYSYADTLYLVTNEDAECVFSNVNCNFIWENATEMTGLLKEHTTSFEEGETYYVKCKDLWNNKPNNCFVVRAVEAD